MLTRWDVHKWKARAQKQILHKLIGFTCFRSGHRLYQFNTKRRLERARLTQQKINMFTEELIEEMNVLIWADNIEQVVQRHLWADHIMTSHQALQHTQ